MDNEKKTTRLILKKILLTTLAVFATLDSFAQGSGFDANGASYARFSVSPTKQVRFARGNLQYQASTKTWRFAEQQYTTIGKSNENISSTYDGWIDLFGFACSGWSNGPEHQPWFTSSKETAYLVGGKSDISLVDKHAYADWAYNKISNGGNQAGMWRTLSIKEWRYLLMEREEAERKCGLATVGKTHGMIILPDQWTTPVGIDFIPGFDGYNDANKYSSRQWRKMEAAGAIFLPATPDRIINEVYGYEDPESGCYWSTTAVNKSAARTITFYTYAVDDGKSSRFSGISVRPVMD